MQWHTYQINEHLSKKKQKIKFGYSIFFFLILMLASVDCVAIKTVGVSEEIPGVAGVETNEART